eukprot:gnl/MRDRNA2_/MRDRNA2_79796_c0_seq1.p1 gnl/MRDRNA2_/MRDRNA2_79796_c0~~gnl/MRDRNA2_/MRDRNA2_79796_c0_seq1.p1  ORF type:complete len:555 (-),score=117.51 gnl/MRDRNA2_/MRDRNA2_79796_c0_seq1:49-1665(-)
MADTAVIKVTLEAKALDAEIRRFRIQYPFEFADLDVLIADAFGRPFTMKYKDSEGDLCTLVKQTFADFIALHDKEDKIFRLRLLKDTEPQAPVKPPQPVITGTWQVHRGHRIGWSNFVEPYASMLTNTLAEGRRFTYLQYLLNDGKVWRYEIDLHEMTQRNLGTGTVRTIRFIDQAGNMTNQKLQPCSELNLSFKEKEYLVKQHNPLFLAMLFKGQERAIMVESVLTGTTVRKSPQLLVDACGDVGRNAVFHAKGVCRLDQSAAITLRSETEDGYLRVNPDSRKLEIGGDGNGREYEFLVVPWGEFGFFGCQLCSTLTGELIHVHEDGSVHMEPYSSNEAGTAFTLRYHAAFDNSWKEDPQFSGKRTWIRDRTNKFWTFEQFVDFTRENKVKTVYGESGILAAKVMWAEAVKEGATEEDYKAVSKFASSIKKRRAFGKKSLQGPLYSFGQMLSFIEARELSSLGKDGLEGCILRWNHVSQFYKDDVKAEKEASDEMANQSDATICQESQEAPVDTAEVDFQLVDVEEVQVPPLDVDEV